MQKNDNWQELNRHLDQLLDLEDAARERRLAKIAESEPALAGQLQRLLAGIAHSASLEDMATTGVFQEALASVEGFGRGDQIGNWTLLGCTGRGGMAEVFEATRTVGGVEQRAAIKLMALGLGSDEQRRRFRQETAILARLEHHRLSRLIDAGTVPDGRPWLAMEFIDGKPIDVACNERGLDLADRVRLMIEVARAVDYCHRALVVHRDLKPSNIFVTPEGKVRLLDFGIAKVQNVKSDNPNETAFNSIGFTLQFTSPEQLAGKITGVDCDIYQLGLVLYLLVTGRRAFEQFEGDIAALQEAMRAGPALPSHACLAGDNSRTGDARRRGHLLRGDLDSIIMHALEPEPGARYPGAREFADDLQRWLDGAPVSARTYTPWYRTARYLRRHWVGAGALAFIFILISGYGITVTWQTKRLAEERNVAELARQRAESIQGFLLQVFGSVDPESQASRGKTVEQLLIEGVERARVEFSDQPLLAAQLLMDMGVVLARRGKLETALGAFTDAQHLRTQELGPDHPDTLATETELGEVLYRLGHGQQALKLLHGHLAAVERVSGAVSDEMIEALIALGQAESVYGDIAKAEQQLDRAMDIHHSLYPGETLDKQSAVLLARLENQLAVILMRAQKYEQALDIQAKSVADFEKLAGRLDTRTVEARKNLGFAYSKLNRPDEARAAFEQTLKDQRELYDGAHWQIAFTYGHLANLAGEDQDYEQALELWRKAEAETRTAMGDDYYWIQSARYRQAQALMMLERKSEARVILRDIVAMGDAAGKNAERAMAMLESDGED